MEAPSNSQPDHAAAAVLPHTLISSMFAPYCSRLMILTATVSSRGIQRQAYTVAVAPLPADENTNALRRRAANC